MSDIAKALCWASALILLGVLSRIFPMSEASFDAAFFGLLALSVVSLSRNGECSWRKAES